MNKRHEYYTNKEGGTQCARCGHWKSIPDIPEYCTPNSQKDNQEKSKCCNAEIKWNVSFVEGCSGNWQYCTKCGKCVGNGFKSMPFKESNSHKDNQTTSESWEDRLEDVINEDYPEINQNRLEDFIRELLQSEKDRLKEKVEGLKIINSSINGCTCKNCKKETGEDYHNEALEAVLELLK